MKTNSRMRLTLAALVLATFAGSLTGQAGDAGLQPVKLLSEAIRLRDEGKLQPALDKAEELLKADPSDEGAKELVASIRLALDEAAKKAAAAAAPAPEAPAAPAAPVAAPAAPIVALSQEHAKLYEEVDAAIARAKNEAEIGRAHV